MADASLSVEQRDDVLLVSFQETSVLDSVTVQRIGRELYALADEPKTRQIVIDFGRIRFLTSQALGVLLTLRRKADKSGVKVALAGLRPELQRVFQLTKLDKLFLFFESRDAALAHFAGGAAGGTG